MVCMFYVLLYATHIGVSSVLDVIYVDMYASKKSQIPITTESGFGGG